MNVVYEIVNTTTGKRYIGSTINSNQRKNKHFRELKNGNHHCVYLQRAWDKQDGVGFVYNIIKEFDTVESCRVYEQELLDSYYEELYNTSKQATGGDLISYHPKKEDIISRMVETNKVRNTKLGVDGRKAIYGRSGSLNGMYGKRHTSESKKAMSAKHKLNPSNGFLGHKHTTETRSKLSELAKKRVGEKNSFYGRTHTQETRARISESRKGVVPTNARRVSADGVIYDSLASCGREIGRTSGAIHNRIKSKNFPNYFYVD